MKRSLRKIRRLRLSVHLVKQRIVDRRTGILENISVRIHQALLQFLMSMASTTKMLSTLISIFLYRQRLRLERADLPHAKT